MIKILALYLPQFHQIKENDEWWGEGFTEWENVKKARKYSVLQDQPRIPLNNNYYDLSNSNSIRWQAKLAKTHNIDGFCFYHYYSKGQKLLETPSEIILNNKDIDIEFCFSWANHDWKRTWAKYSNEILRKQEYGNHQDIVDHFNYLLPFFKDKRYIKIDNQPFFSIYEKIPTLVFEDIINTFNTMAKENGFDGIYFVETLRGNHNLNNNYSGHFCFEPNYSNAITDNYIWKVEINLKRKISDLLNKLGNKNFIINKYNYITACERIIKTIDFHSTQENVSPGFFVGWDNTPRHGINGSFYKKQNIENVRKFFYIIMKKSIEYEKEFIFINAWNEWGEGAYLEPDESNGTKMLEIIKEVSDELQKKGK